MNLINVVTRLHSVPFRVLLTTESDFEFAMNSISYWYAEKRSVYFARLYGSPMLRCEWKKNRDDRSSICFQHMYRKEICMKVRTISTILTLENCCCREAGRGSLTSECNSPRTPTQGVYIGAQTVNIQFALVSFSYNFWAKKTPHTVSM